MWSPIFASLRRELQHFFESALLRASPLQINIQNRHFKVVAGLAFFFVDIDGGCEFVGKVDF